MDTEKFKTFFTRRNTVLLLVIVFLVIPNTWRFLVSCGFFRSTPPPAVAAQYGIVIPPDTICLNYKGSSSQDTPFSILYLFSEEPFQIQPEMGFTTTEAPPDKFPFYLFQIPRRFFYLKISSPEDIRRYTGFARTETGKDLLVHGGIVEAKKGYYLLLYLTRRPPSRQLTIEADQARPEAARQSLPAADGLPAPARTPTE